MDGHPATGSPQISVRTTRTRIIRKETSAEYHAEHCCHRQRSHRKPGNSLQRIFKKLAQGPLGLSRRPLHILIFQPFGPEPTQLKIPLEKRLYTTHLQHGIHHLPAHDPVISGTVYQLRFEILLINL